MGGEEGKGETIENSRVIGMAHQRCNWERKMRVGVYSAFTKCSILSRSERLDKGKSQITYINYIFPCKENDSN